MKNWMNGYVSIPKATETRKSYKTVRARAISLHSNLMKEESDGKERTERVSSQIDG